MYVHIVPRALVSNEMVSTLYSADHRAAAELGSRCGVRRRDLRRIRGTGAPSTSDKVQGYEEQAHLASVLALRPLGPL